MFHAVVHPGARAALADELDVNALDALRVPLDQSLLEPDEAVQIDAAGCPSSIRRHLRAAAARSRGPAAQQRRLHFEHVSRPVASVLDILDLRHILMDEARLTPPSSNRRVRGDRLCNPPD